MGVSCHKWTESVSQFQLIPLAARTCLRATSLSGTCPRAFSRTSSSTFHFSTHFSTHHTSFPFLSIVKWSTNTMEANQVGRGHTIGIDSKMLIKIFMPFNLILSVDRFTISLKAYYVVLVTKTDHAAQGTNSLQTSRPNLIPHWKPRSLVQFTTGHTPASSPVRYLMQIAQLQSASVEQHSTAAQ